MRHTCVRGAETVGGPVSVWGLVGKGCNKQTDSWLSGVGWEAKTNRCRWEAKNSGCGWEVNSIGMWLGSPCCSENVLFDQFTPSLLQSSSCFQSVGREIAGDVGRAQARQLELIWPPQHFASRFGAHRKPCLQSCLQGPRGEV